MTRTWQVFLVGAFTGAMLSAQSDVAQVVLPATNPEIDAFNAKYLVVTRALMSPKSVADAFGRRIAQRYIAMQVTVANRNTEYQWLITDGAIGLTRFITRLNESTCAAQKAHLLGLLAASGKFAPNPQVTGSDLTVLRGVAEKGQILDPRNLTFRILQSSGTIAAGLLGITTFGPAFAPSVAAFNGPFLNAYQTAFPDQTVNQLNRLNDSAYAANTVVPKQQARVLVVFIPMSLLLTSKQQKQFYKDSNSVLTDDCTDLRLLDASVDGHFVTQLNLTPVITSVTIPAAEMAKFSTDNFKVSGTILGRFLEDTNLSLTGAPAGLSVVASGNATADRVNFQLSSVKPLQPQTVITLTLTKKGLPPANFSFAAAYSPSRPTILATGGVSPASLMQGDSEAVEVSGADLAPQTSVHFTDSKGLTIGDPEYVSTSKIRVNIGVANDAADGPREFFLRTAGGDSGKAILTITKKP